MLSEWYVVVSGDGADVAVLEDLLRSSTEHSVIEEQPGERRLRSLRVAGMSGHEAAWETLRGLLSDLADAAAAVSTTRLHLRPGAQGRSNPAGGADIFVHPEPIVVRVRAFPPTIVIGGAPPTEPHAAKMLRLQATNDQVRLALHFLNAEENWYALYKTFEVIKDANGGKKGIVAKGWASRDGIDRFSNTANNYRAVGDAARHARLGRRPPPNPLTLVVADDWVRALLSQWLGSLP